MSVQLNNLMTPESLKDCDYLWKSYNQWNYCRKNENVKYVNENFLKHSCGEDDTKRCDTLHCIQELPEDIRNELENIFNTGIINENALDLNHIEHFLFASQHLNTLKVACEEKLLRNLTAKNCWELLCLADRYDLSWLRNAALHNIENGHFKNVLKCAAQTNKVKNPVHELYHRYTTLFTINSTKHSLQVVVLDPNLDVRCYRNLKYCKKTATEFETCCLHSDKEDSPHVYWVSGKSLSMYDPILNKRTKCKPLKYKRCNFALVGYGQCSYIIGGTYKEQNIVDIDQYDCVRNTWRKVASLPGHIKTSNLACEATGDLVYIFALDDSNIVVCTFKPENSKVNVILNIPLRFNQIKTCFNEDSIYLASDEDHFLKFSTLDHSVTLLPTQSRKCKDFGLFAQNGSVFIVGGKTVDGNTSNTIYEFCISASCWTLLNKTLPDKMSIAGVCDLRICKCSNMTVVPFYENNYLEIRS